MTTNSNHRQPSLGNSGRGASFPICRGGCNRPVIHATGELSWCPTCWYLEETLSREKCPSVAELIFRHEETLGRVIDLLRRSGVDDAGTLIRRLNR